MQIRCYVILDRFMSLYGRVNQSPLGAGPVGGTSLPIDRDSTAKLLDSHLL